MYSQSSRFHQLPEIPDTLLTPRLRADYLVEHYWDKIDDGLFCGIDKEGDERVVADYLLFAGMADNTAYRESIDLLLKHISGQENRCRTLLDYLSKYLYGLDSPYRDDEKFEATLSMLLSSSPSRLFSAQIAYLMEMAANSKPGSKAADFEYLTKDGVRHTLHESAGHPVLLVFYYPGCRDCRNHELALERSDAVTQAIDNGLEVIFICPEGDVSDWLKERSSSSRFRKGFDCSATIVSEGGYMFRSTPATYLLDENMNILLKEPTLSVCLDSLCRCQSYFY